VEKNLDLKGKKWSEEKKYKCKQQIKISKGREKN